MIQTPSPLRILHVLSQTELTGAETYALELAQEQKKRGHTTWLVSDQLHLATDIPLFRQPISRRSYSQRWRNISFLRRFMRENNVDVIHAHSRAASWVCYYATMGTRVAYISTVHGRQHLHFSVKAHDVYGDRVIAVASNLREHLVKEVGMKADKLLQIPNGVDFSQLLPRRESPERIRLALLGRTSGPKGERAGLLLQHVIPDLLREFPRLDVVLAGGPAERLDERSRATLRRLEEEFPSRVQSLGLQPYEQFLATLASATAVIGSGRIAIKALALDVPLFALGESASHGWVSDENFGAVVATNFGDVSAGQPRPLDLPGILGELRLALRQGLPRPSLAARVTQIFSLAAVATRIEAEYRKALFVKNVRHWIPVLMYHKVESQHEDAAAQSRHRIFVTARRFRQHLRFLRARRFETLTFRDLRDFTQGLRPWKDFPRRPLILTFDDGYDSTYRNALPLLDEFRYRAVFYVLGEKTLRVNAWDVKEGEPASELADHSNWKSILGQGHEIGAHSMTHPRLTEVAPTLVEQEVRGSWQIIKEMTGENPASFAYPYGNLSPAVKEEVSNAGFAFGVATDTGGLHVAHDPYQVFRVSIFPEDGPYQIWKKTSSWYRRYYRWKRGQ